MPARRSVANSPSRDCTGISRRRAISPIGVMAVIFALSAQPDLSSGLGTIDLVGRKFVHASEYALLCFLWWRALRTVTADRRAVAAAFAICVAYSATDE